MATFLSPGVFPREIDLSLVPNTVGPTRPAFIGTAKKGPLNTPVFISNSQQYVDTFGEPFPESYMGYAVLNYMEEGNQCYIVRVGVECQDGQPEELSDICIDTSGNRVDGWGRIPLFTGIDFGRISFREVNTDNPAVFHLAAVENIDYNDIDLSPTDGPTGATLSFTGTDLSDGYTGAIDDSWLVLILSDPDTGEVMTGAQFEVVRNSDAAIVASGTLTDDGSGESQVIDIGQGLAFKIVVTSGALEVNDSFTFTAKPDNTTFSLSVEGEVSPTEYTITPATYTDVDDLVDDLNALMAGAEDYIFINRLLADGSNIPQARTDEAGDRIQIVSTEAWALELGQTLWAWDIPRSNLIGIDPEPYTFTSQNNRISMSIQNNIEEVTTEFSVGVGVDIDADTIASQIDLGGIVAGERLFESFAITIPTGTRHVVIATTTDNQFDQLRLNASFSNLKTLRFAEELGVLFPYTEAYRGFTDFRVEVPESGSITPESPASCEDDPFSDECAVDTAYFENIVGYFVATSAGTWLDGYELDLFLKSQGPDAGQDPRYNVLIRDNQNVQVDLIENVSFDQNSDRYIGNIVNPSTQTQEGQTLGGNEFVNWEERPAFLSNDPSADDYVVRDPAQIFNKEFSGMANGIPLDPAYSNELDAAVIGNPAENTGMYAFQNSETFDINIMATPGFNSGAVIGRALQICETRGDVIYLVDPPFGLRPQQVVDWHNGMLLSNLNQTIDSSYGALYWGWLKTFDQFNAQEIWVPPSGYISSVYARNDRVAEQWFAPAGLRRGQLTTALEVEFNPSMGERDLLYGGGNSVNPIVNFPQDGITVFGQRTLQRTETALSRVNVRRLLIFIKKNLTRTLRNFIFEPNDEILWAQVRNVVDPFLADIQARRGLEDYRIVVDETNNTPERRDRNQLWVSVFLQPTKAVEFIVLNLVILRSSASFNAEEVLAAGGVVTV
jgi:phage tail sheath protein FI